MVPELITIVNRQLLPYFQPIIIETPEKELENLSATSKNNDDVYQSAVDAITKQTMEIIIYIYI